MEGAGPRRGTGRPRSLDRAGQDRQRRARRLGSRCDARTGARRSADPLFGPDLHAGPVRRSRAVARLLHRQPDARDVHDGDVDRHVHPRLRHGLHERRVDRGLRRSRGPHGRRRPLPPAGAVLPLLLVHVAVLLLDAGPGAGRQYLPGVHLLGAGRHLQLPAHRFLCRTPFGEHGRQQGVHHEPRRRLRLFDRPDDPVDVVRHVPVSRNTTSAARRGPGLFEMLRDSEGRTRRRRRPTTSCDCTTRRVSTRTIPYMLLVAAGLGRVCRLRRQERPVPAADLASRRDGGADARFGPRALCHDGRRRRVSGRAVLSDVHARGAADDRLRRLHHAVCGGDDCGRGDRHQAGARLFDDQPARLHDAGHRRGGLGSGTVPSGHARLLQVAHVPRLGQRDHGLPSRAGHVADGGPAARRCRSPRSRCWWA